MRATASLRDLTARDLMTQDVFTLAETMPLRDAARALVARGVSGAPVVDAAGRCVGVLSAGDYLRRVATGGRTESQPRRPVTCSFQIHHRMEDGREETLCMLSPGACPIQMRQQGPTGEDLLICREPHSVPVDWQVVELEKLPTDDVGRYMTPNPVTAAQDTLLPTLARMMIDAHVHRVIVVDEAGKPVGVVSSTDLLAALAYSEQDGSAAVRGT
jgi:CBS domain-containing protein